MSDANTMETTEEPTPAEFQPIEESTSQTTDMTLDWLCWERATSGERFYRRSRPSASGLDPEGEGRKPH